MTNNSLPWPWHNSSSEQSLVSSSQPAESEDAVTMAAMVVVQDEQLRWLNHFRPGEVIYHDKNKLIDYYGVTFDHAVPKACQNPQVLQIIIYETEYDGATVANSSLKTPIDPKNYVPYKPRVYAAYRCCHIQAGPYDALRINEGVRKWHKERVERSGRFLNTS